jgi:hypothetical protein
LDNCHDAVKATEFYGKVLALTASPGTQQKPERRRAGDGCSELSRGKKGDCHYSSQG